MTRKAGATGLAAVAGAIACLIACRQLVDFREEPSPTGVPPETLTESDLDGGAACGLGYGTSRCASCVHTDCCTESTACAADPACKPYAACVGACAGDPTCRAHCALDSPTGYPSAGPALSACLVAKCESECGLTCGAIVSGASYRGVSPDAAAGCESCIASNGGCAASHACGASEDCQGDLFCNGTCATIDCKWACLQAHDAGYAQAVASSIVTGGNCSSECEHGASWSCVGHVNWPRPKSNRVTLTIVVEDKGNTDVKYPGVDVSVCSRNTVDCGVDWIAHGTTDGAGRAVLTFLNPVDSDNHGLDGYVQLYDPSEAGTPKIAPWLYYWGSPLSESELALEDFPNWNFGIKVLTPDELNALGTPLGFPYDPTKSLLFAGTSDCEERLAPGVLVTTIPESPTGPVYGLTPGNQATDSLGFAAFAGLPTGSVDVIATPVTLGKPSSSQTVNVSPGWVTTVTMLPTP